MASTLQSSQPMSSTLPTLPLIPSLPQIPTRKRGGLHVAESHQRQIVVRRSQVPCLEAYDRVRIPTQHSAAQAKRYCSAPQSQPPSKYSKVTASSHCTQKSFENTQADGFTTGSALQNRGKEISGYISSHSRSPLAPCLSSTTLNVSPSISQLSPGGSQKILQKQKLRLLPPNWNGRQIGLLQPDDPNDYDHSPTDCARDFRRPAFRRITPSEQRHQDRNEILSIFLKNTGGYLDDSEDEENEEEEGRGEIRNSSFLTRLSYPFEFRHASTSFRKSSFLSSQYSTSTRSSSSSSTNSATRHVSSDNVPTHLSQLPIQKALSLISQKYA